MSQIKYETQVWGTGRNGTYYQMGLDLRMLDYGGNGPVLELTGITSKGKVAVGGIQIPKENIQELIDELEKLKKYEY